MGKYLKVNHEKCTACRRCELVCSLKRSGEFNPAKACLSVATFLDDDFYFPVTCQHCEEPLCQKVCPAGAVVRNEVTGAVEIDQDRCIGCKMCIMACPFGAPVSVPETGKVTKCDLCQGEPECVSFCQWGALEYVEADRAAVAKRREVARRLMDVLREVAG
ncbi:MAG: 4Fe-4S dicluster domain-containing protein [Bacillota bacterium]|nr:4Fe-4S dicluster domain-containing protein [Bacillota bacterium]